LTFTPSGQEINLAYFTSPRVHNPRTRWKPHKWCNSYPTDTYAIRISRPNGVQTRKANRPDELRMMPPPGLQIYLWLRVILIFDLLTQTFHALPMWTGPLVPSGIKISSFVFKISCSQVWQQPNERKHGHTEQADNIMPPLANLACWRVETNKQLVLSAHQVPPL